MENIIIFSESDLKQMLVKTMEETFENKLKELLSQTVIPALPKYLTIDQAASYLNTSKQTLYKYTSEKTIPFIKAPFGLRFIQSDLDEWLELKRNLTIKQIEDKVNVRLSSTKIASK